MKIIRHLSLSLVVLILAAAATEAQMNPNHMHQHQGVQGKSVEELAKQLSSNDPDTRLDAVRALGMSKDRRAIDFLIKAVDDSDVRVQAKAIQLLGDLRADESTPTLVQCLIMRTTDVRLQQLVLTSLGKIGDVRAAPPVLEFLKRDLDVATRGTAIFALGDIGTAEAADVLEHIAKTDEDPVIRRVANEAASKIVAHYGTTRDDDRATADDSQEPRAPTPAHQNHHQHY